MLGPVYFQSSFTSLDRALYIPVGNFLQWVPWVFSCGLASWLQVVLQSGVRDVVVLVPRVVVDGLVVHPDDHPCG